MFLHYLDSKTHHRSGSHSAGNTFVMGNKMLSTTHVRRVRPVSSSSHRTKRPNCELVFELAYIKWTLPFSTFGGVTVPNVHTGSVGGFLVGEPIFVPKPDQLGLDGWTKGHFAYAVIHWNKYQEVKTLSDRGYYLQQVFLPNEEGQPQYNANTRFLHFSTGSTDQQGIADIITGPWAAFRYQPYKKHGLESTDLSYRRLTPQVHIIVWVDWQVRNIGKFVAKDKEGKNA